MRFLPLTAALVLLAGCADPPPPAEPAGVAGFRDNVKALAAANHPWWNYALSVADGKTTPYASQGQWHAIAYSVTGNQAHADKALAFILPRITKDPTDANYVREYFAELGVWYWLLKPGMSPDQDAAYKKGLDRWAEWCCGINTAPYVGGWRYGDSDQTTGQYFGVVLTQGITGTDWLSRPDVVKARAAVDSFCDKAAGGEWIESGEYNLGTVRLLVLGAYAAGIDNYPKVKALVPQFAEQFTWTVTPDRAQLVQWGDEEKPRDNQRYQTIPYAATFAGLTGRYDLQQLTDQLSAGVPVQTQIYLGWRALYFYKPVAPPANTFLRFAEGGGHVRYRRDGVLVAVHLAQDVGVDHAPPYKCSFQAYSKGQWSVREPLGYGSVAVSSVAKNDALLAGLSKMAVRAKPVVTETPTGFVATCSTSGPYYAAGYYNPPPKFLTKYQRTITYTHPERFDVTDEFDGVHPNTLPNYARYAAADKALIEAAPGLWTVVYHAQTLPAQLATGGFQWATPDGRTSTLTANGPADLKFQVIDEKALWAGNPQFRDAERLYQIRLYTNEPRTTVRTTLEVR